MLTLHKILVHRAVGYAGYLTSVSASGDYYVSDDGDPWAAPGEWRGSLTAELELAERDVEMRALLMLMEGRDPRTAQRVVRLGPASRRIAAHDLVFSAPSSVSAAWALADDSLREAIQRAQDAAVAEAFAHIERTFPLVRRRDPTAQAQAVGALRRRLGRVPTLDESRHLPAPIVNETAAALVGAAFSHHTARQTAHQAQYGLPPDPQLHTHLVLPGFARRHDGAYVAVDSLTLFRGRREAGAVYRASLAAHLAEAGFAIERGTGSGGQYFELAGVPTELRECWSSRHGEIQDSLKRWRAEMREQLGREPTKAEEHEWGARSRTPKRRFTRCDLFQWWTDMAGYYGVDADTVRGLAQNRAALPSPEDGRAALTAELLSPEGITREHAAFDMRTLRTEAYQRAPGLVAVADVDRVLSDLVRRDDVVEISRGVWTTSEILDLEDGVLRWHSDMQHRAAEPPASHAVQAAVASAPVDLSDEQSVALQSILGNRFTALTGEAGTGKGVVLRVASTVWRDQSRRAFAVALAGARAQALAADMGDDVTALTLDAFVRRVNSGRIELRESDVIAVDEAGQIDTRRWAALTEAIGARATVVALGDHAQLSSISAGGLWPLLAQNGPKLTEVRRTRHAWERQAWAHLRRGEAMQGLGLYARRGNVDVSDTRADALDRAVASWDADGRDGLIITDASNAERHRANHAAQQRRVDHGDVGAAAVAASTAQGRVRFHAGDRVIFTAQHQDDDLGRRVENGTTGDVIAVDQAAHVIRVRTHEAQPREIALRVGHGAPSPSPLDLFYAAHVYKSQGATVRRAYVVAGGWQTNRESLYVAASRSRDGTRIFVDRTTLDRTVDADALAELARRGARSRAKVAATSLRTPPVSLPDLPARFAASRRRRAAKREERRAAAPQLSESRSLSFLPGHGPVWVPWSRLPETPDTTHEVPRHGWR